MTMTDDEIWNDGDETKVAKPEATLGSLRQKGSGAPSALQRQAREVGRKKGALDHRHERFKGERVQLNVRVPPEFKEQIARLARKDKTMPGDFIVAACTEYIERHGLDKKSKPE